MQVYVTGRGPARPVAQIMVSLEHEKGEGEPQGLLLLASQEVWLIKQRIPAPFGTPLTTSYLSALCTKLYGVGPACPVAHTAMA